MPSGGQNAIQWNETLQAALEKLLDEGASLGEMQRVLGVHKVSIMRRMQRLGYWIEIIRIVHRDGVPIMGPRRPDNRMRRRGEGTTRADRARPPENASVTKNTAMGAAAAYRSPPAPRQ